MGHTPPPPLRLWRGWALGTALFPPFKLAKRQRRPLGQSVSTILIVLIVHNKDVMI